MTALTDLGFTYDEANQLRRIEMTLHRWAEHECNGNIERIGDDGSGYPVWVSNPGMGELRRQNRIADRERGALRRLNAIVFARNSRRSDGPVAHYVQDDPRGCGLYIVRRSDIPAGERIDSYYTRGIAVAT